MKKKSKLIIAITLMACILISITFITLNKQVKQKSVDNNPIASDTNNEKSGDEKNSDEKNDSEKKASEEDISNESENVKDNSDEKDDVVNNSDENKSKDANTSKVNSDNSNSNENLAAEEPSSTPSAEREPSEKYVTLSITANTILNNMDKVSEGKKDIIPSNGVILGEVKVKIEDGDTVFDILKRETRKNRIHMDFVESPVYGSAYIKGIANIYEFDAGDLSGWMYSVNGVFPGYGASNAKVENGDVIKWQYTCDLGRDLGNEF